MDTDSLRQYLEFYRDLGIREVYRRAAPVSQAVQATPEIPPPPVRQSPVEPAPMPVILPSIEPAGDTLFQILTDIGDCRRCRLHEGRTHIVFGVGNERAPLVFVGEGPGA